jgi:hypothetical protein
MPNLIERYMNGEHREVWHELRQTGALNVDDARIVATETMRRVARNANRIAARLNACGWRSLSGALRSRTRDSDQQIIQRIERFTEAPVPVSLQAFWLNVGGIDFVWDYKSKRSIPQLISELAMDAMDPLCVDPPEAANFLIEEWKDQSNSFVAPYRIELSPDHLHKMNISGGSPYGIDVPFSGADPVFHDDRHELPFVDYLRHCFRFAGFPLLDRIAERDDVRLFLNEWTSDLEEF